MVLGVLEVLADLGDQGVQEDLVYPLYEGSEVHQCLGVQCVAAEVVAESENGSKIFRK